MNRLSICSLQEELDRGEFTDNPASMDLNQTASVPMRFARAVINELRPRQVRALVLADERADRERLCSLRERTDSVELVGECANGIEAVGVIHVSAPELLVLDVNRPTLNALTILESIEPERCPHIMFLTSNDKHVQRALECMPWTTCASRLPTNVFTMRLAVLAVSCTSDRDRRQRPTIASLRWSPSCGAEKDRSATGLSFRTGSRGRIACYVRARSTGSRRRTAAC
ncbi:MAG: response regulator [Gemmatimonas sp.]|nr:response regulator [Gemmatimonas sp.]